MVVEWESEAKAGCKMSGKVNKVSEIETCYLNLLELHRSLKPWSKLFNSCAPSSRNEHILIVDEYSATILEISESIREKSRHCNTEGLLGDDNDVIEHNDWEVEKNLNHQPFEVGADPKTYQAWLDWQRNNPEPAAGRTKKMLLRCSHRAEHLAKLLADRAIEYQVWSDLQKNWTKIYQDITVKDIQVACRDGLRAAGSLLGKSKNEVARDMVSPPSASKANEQAVDSQKRESANVRLMALLQNNQDVITWTAEKFAAELQVTPSAIKQTDTWKTMMLLRDDSKQQAADSFNDRTGKPR